MFDQSYGKLVKSLIGKTIIFDGQEVEVVEAVGYSRRENEPAPYTEVLAMRPGQVFCPRHRGGLLVLIACLDGVTSGGCILLRKVKKNGRIISGPGRVAGALGIVRPNTRGRMAAKGEVISLTLNAA